MIFCTGHKNWVLCIAWSPNSKYLVSGCKNGMIMSWNVETGKRIGPPMTGHKQWITALCWAPYHLYPECRMYSDFCLNVINFGQCLKFKNNLDLPVVVKMETFVFGMSYLVSVKDLSLAIHVVLPV
jgi:WD40 repeat protein